MIFKRSQSLLSICTEYIVDNLHVYLNDDNDLIQCLPSHIKDKILHKFTISSFFWRHLHFKKALKELVHTNTQHIDLTSVYVDDQILESLSECHNLKRVYLLRVGPHNITSKGLTDFFTNKHLINFLVLSNCDVVTDDVLESIAENCPSLEALDLGSCRNVTDKGVKALAKIKNLQNLILSTTQVSNIGLEYLVKSENGAKLKELRIDNCRNITDIGVLKVAENCPNLEVLIFNNCSTQRDNDTLSILEDGHLKKLKQLTWTVTW